MRCQLASFHGTDAADAALATVPKEVVFNGSDVDSGCALRPGDEVVLDVFRVKADKSLLAKKLTIVKLSGRYREQGVVTTTKDNFGFIRCCQREMGNTHPSRAGSTE